MKRHRLDRNATVYSYLRWKDKRVVTVCGFHFSVRHDQYKVTIRWDATTCLFCLKEFGMPKVDYSAIEEMDFSPIPNGTYDAVLTGWDLKDGDAGPYYNCEYTLDESAGEFNNRKVWKVCSLSPKALWGFKRDMVRLGADPERMAPGSDEDTDDVIASQVGGSCRLVLEQEEYEANDGEMKIKNNIKEVKVAADLPF